MGSQADINDAARAEIKVLESEKRRLESEIEALKIPAYVATFTTNLAIVTDKVGRIVWTNRAFRDYTSYEQADVLGKKPGEVLQGPATDPATVQKMHDAIRAHETCSVEVVNYTKAKRAYWVDLRISPVFDRAGELVNMISVAQDISAHKAAEAELRRSNNELTQFASIASHDLREPLRMVTGFLDILEHQYGEVLGEDGTELIGFATDGARRMRRLITDLLSLSKIQIGANSALEADAGSAVKAAMRNLSQKVTEAGATVVYDDLPTVKMDQSYLSQLFQNMIENAINFRGKELPRVEITSRLDGDWQEISVADNGVGIQPELKDSIFEMFRQTRKFGPGDGGGIGLAICKKIVEAHGGRIWVESEVGQGARFIFQIPRANGIAQVAPSLEHANHG